MPKTYRKGAGVQGEKKRKDTILLSFLTTSQWDSDPVGSLAASLGLGGVK